MLDVHPIRSLKVAALIALALGSTFSSPLPAFASTLTVTSLDCEVRHGGFICDAHVSGGTGGYTYTWNQVATSRVDGVDSSRMAAACAVGSSPRVSFFVSDSAGATASRTQIVNC